MAQDNYSILISKLDTFVRKYYINQMIRGGLYTLGLIGLLFVAINLLEHYYFFGKAGRKMLFFGFVGVSLVALTYWVITPLLHYFNLGKVISHEHAAKVIGDHFPDVKDKLINVLQLKKSTSSDAHLVLASINQKTEEIKLVPFPKAIDLSKNKKYLRYALPPLLLLLMLLFAAPSLIKDSTTRLINNNTEFTRDAPFKYIVSDESPEVVQYSDLDIKVDIEGDMIPNEVFISVDNYQYRLKKENNGSFSYRFNNVDKKTSFQLFAAGLRGQKVESKIYEIDVLKKPNILGFEIDLDFPSYTLRKDEKLLNVGDLSVPQGTNIKWVFNAAHTDDINIRFNNEGNLFDAEKFSEELFAFKKKAMRNESYKLFVSNSFLPFADSVGYSIRVTPDLAPTIDVKVFADSTAADLQYFAGEASDDYGLKNLSFNYLITDAKGVQQPLESVALDIDANRNIQYTHNWDISDLDLKPGDKVDYYFEIYDNDAVNGSKSAKTSLMSLEIPTIEEFEKQEEQNSDEIKEKLKESLKENKRIQKEMKKLRDKVLQQKEMDWQTKKELEKLLEQHQDLQENIEKAKEKFEENLKNQEKFAEQSEEILEKQEKLKELFEEVMSDEMKELMEQIQELMQELNKDSMLDMMEQMEMDDMEVEMELDRLMELYKNLEVEAEMNKMMEKLEELAEKQEELAEETEGEKSPQEELEEKQKEINEEFDKLQEKMEDIEKKNEDLEKPKDLGEENEEQMEDIEKDLEESQEQLGEKQNKKASKAQKQAAEKMKQMSQQMESSMQSGEMEQMEEDMRALRQLLENLVALSFDQEDLMADLDFSTINTPVYVSLVQQQYKLKDDFGLVKDSLQALAKRVFQIESFITEKVNEVDHNIAKGLEQLEERKKPQAADNQQRTMKNVNDLALMLSEVMEQMQQQMSSMMSGSQMCNKPGGAGGKPGSVPMDKISEGQKGLNEQMKKMKEGMKEGKGPGSKEFAQMAARQAALQKALRDLKKQAQQRGQGGQELQEILDQMNKNETELVNKNLTNEMIKRQEDILTRLLQADQAEREREYENKRKADTATQQERKAPPSLEEYLKQREAEIELYKTVNPSLKPYYKILVQEYINQLKEN